MRTQPASTSTAPKQHALIGMSAQSSRAIGGRPVKVVSTTETITPAMAKSYLETMIVNRPVSDSKMVDYSLAMRDGRWSHNGETVKFDADGHLFDGQHRMLASIQSGKPFTSVVVRGVADENAFSTVDCGKVRTSSDVFSIDGWANASVVPGAATIVYGLTHKNGMGWSGPTEKYARKKLGDKFEQPMKHSSRRNSLMSPSELCSYANSFRADLTESVRFAVSSKAKKFLPAATIAGLHYVFSRKDPVAAEHFFHQIGTGEGLLKGDPVYALREKLISCLGSSSKLPRWTILGYTIKAWNKRRAGGRLTQLKIAENEEFPTII